MGTIGLSRPMDRLKGNKQYRDSLGKSRLDIIVIDAYHNVDMCKGNPGSILCVLLGLTRNCKGQPLIAEWKVVVVIVDATVGAACFRAAPTWKAA